MAERMVTTTVEGNHIHFDFKAGGLERLTFDMSRPGEDVRAEATINGWRQKIQDAASDAKSPADKRGAMLKMVDQLYHNVWSAKGGGASGFNSGYATEALARVKFDGNVTLTNAKVDAYASKLAIPRDEALRKLLGDARVATEYDRIRRERAPKPVVDADAELDALMGDEEEETDE